MDEPGHSQYQEKQQEETGDAQHFAAEMADTAFNADGIIQPDQRSHEKAHYTEYSTVNSAVVLLEIR